MSGVKAMIDALNVIYEQKETRSFIKLNLVALAFTLAGFAAFLLAIASIIVLPLILSPIGLGALPIRSPGRPLAGAAYRLVDRSRSPLPLRPGSPRCALAVGDCWQRIRCGDVDHRVVPVLLVSRQLCKLQRDLWVAWRRCRRNDLVVDFEHRYAAWCRAQR
jgi:hypothetical protein